MKKLDNYINSFNKNLDIKITVLKVQTSNPLDENFIPKTNINKFKGLSLISKILISSLATLAVLFTAFMLLVPESDYILVKGFLNTKQFITGEENKFFNENYLNIKDIVYLELSDSELDKIGVIKINDTLLINTEEMFYPLEFFNDELPKELNLSKVDTTEYKHKMKKNYYYDILRLNKKGYDTNQIQLKKYHSKISFYKFNRYILHYNEWQHDKFNQFAPVSIQNICYGKIVRTSYMSNIYGSPILADFKEGLDSINRNFSCLSDPKSIKEIGALSRLIPVKIKMYNKSMSKPEKNKYIIERSECILWFVPTEEFLNALPERFGLRIRNELRIIDKIEKGEITTKDACKELGNEESILGICLNYHDNLEITSIYPSPGREDTRIKFTNGKQQNLSIVNYDLNGNEISKIADKKSFSSGSHEILLDLSNMESGFYLIVIIDEEGNAISSKFMKE